MVKVAVVDDGRIEGSLGEVVAVALDLTCEKCVVRGKIGGDEESNGRRPDLPIPTRS